MPLYSRARATFRLHSHAVAYGTGSGQQSVTAVAESADPNSMWAVKEAVGEPMCRQGAPFACDAKIRLMHLATHKFLHSHQFQSPLSNQQEVSAFGDGQGGGSDDGDSWQLSCASGGPVWERDAHVRLRHVVTGHYLYTASSALFTHHNCPNCPIVGQQEVSASAHQQPWWRTDEGIYFEPEAAGAESGAHSSAHDEL